MHRGVSVVWAGHADPKKQLGVIYPLEARDGVWQPIIDAEGDHAPYYVPTWPPRLEIAGFYDLQTPATSHPPGPPLDIATRAPQGEAQARLRTEREEARAFTALLRERPTNPKRSTRKKHASATHQEPPWNDGGCLVQMLCVTLREKCRLISCYSFLLSFFFP